MSPASSGTSLEVEKYIGACLISRKQPPRDAFYVQNSFFQRCAGMPLISFARQQPRRPPEDASRLAGAPLILSKPARKNYNHSKSKTDAASVTSDESCSSAASDNSLPRIIKPRKRRKKERKGGGSSAGSSPEIAELPFVFEETPQLHHSFEDVEEVAETREASSDCQCRYCDPSGQIWDPQGGLFGESLLPKSRDDCLVCGMASVSLGGGSLEVSTQIVTSLNGHRDLEIKFFSSGTACANKNCAFLCEE